MEFDDFKREFKNDPVRFVAMVGTALGGVAALVNAVSASRGRRAYAKQVNYRIKNKK